MKYALMTLLVAAGTLAGAAINGDLTATAAESCENLASLKLQNTTIALAQMVPTGGFSRPSIGPLPFEQAFSNSVAFCRVSATLTPSSDSDIKVEVWMPASGWNGKFQAVGNGGWAGLLSYPAMSEALRRGYATSSTDTGHTGGSGSFVLGHPEKFIDFAYRSEHEMTVKAKAIVNAFYGRTSTYSYWNGCSTGGRQGLAEVQRYPNDFDGVIAGAQANPRSHPS
jgi:feruloyl esterase